MAYHGIASKFRISSMASGGGGGGFSISSWLTPVRKLITDASIDYQIDYRIDDRTDVQLMINESIINLLSI